MTGIKKINIQVIYLIMLTALSLHADFAHSQSYQWGNVKIGGGGFVTSIITSKTQQDLVYARTDVGGAYRWDAIASKWIPLLDWAASGQSGYLGVSSLALDPQSSNNLYMLVGLYNGSTAILHSNDYGNTFAITSVTSQFTTDGNGMGRQNGERLAVDPHNGNILYCGTRSQGLFKSTDAGVTWNNVSSFGVPNTPNGNGICFVQFDPASDTSGNYTHNIFFGVSKTGQNLFMSNDGGTTFVPVPGADTTLMPQKSVMTGDSTLYITYADLEGPWNPTKGKIWKYHIPTSAWTNVTPSGTTFPYSGISVDPNNPQRLIASTINVYWTQYSNAYGDRFFLSNDGGSTWRDLVGSSGILFDRSGSTLLSGQAIHWAGSIEFNPFNTNEAWINSGNGIFSCYNVNAAQTTWKFNCEGFEETVPNDIASITGGPLFSVIGDYDGFRHTDITQYAPILSPRMGSTTGIAFAALNPNILVRVGSKMYYTTNGGNSWTKCPVMNGSNGKVAVSADGSVFLHCPSGSTTMYRSVNKGSSWTACSGISVTSAVPVADMVNPNKFYVYNNSTGVMMVSTDGGISFSSAGSPGTAFYKIIRTVPGKEGHIWVPASSNGLMRSTDSGVTFTQIAGITNCKAVGLGKAATDSTYHTVYIWGTIGGVQGIYSSTDEGVSWVRVNDNAHQFGGIGNGQFVTGDMNVYGRVYMSSIGRGLICGSIQSAPVNQSIVGPVNVSANATGISYSIPADSGSTFNWIVPPGATVVSGQGTDSITVDFGNTSGTVQVTEINAYGNASSYATVNVSAVTGILSSTASSSANVLAYPNPFSEKIDITFNASSSSALTLKVVDMKGEPVYESGLYHTNEKIILGDELPSTGIYLVMAISNNEIRYIKVEKK